MSFLRRMLALPPPAMALYMVVAIGVSAFALASFATLIPSYLAVGYDYRTEALMVSGQVLFQWMFMGRCSWPQRGKYAVIALTISLLGSLLLFPLLAYDAILGASEPLAVAYFFGVVAVIFAAHHHLVKAEGLPALLAVTWVVYRLLLLAYLTIPR